MRKTQNTPFNTARVACHGRPGRDDAREGHLYFRPEMVQLTHG